LNCATSICQRRRAVYGKHSTEYTRLGALRRLYITSWALRSRVLSRAATDRGFP
jgi:hypothetical protein